MPPPSRAMYFRRIVPRGSPSPMPVGRARTTRAPPADAGAARVGEAVTPRRAAPPPHHAADQAVGRDDGGEPRDVVAAAAVHGERADPAAPLARDDLGAHRRQREALLEAEETAQPVVLHRRLGDLERLDAQLLVLV